MQSLSSFCVWCFTGSSSSDAAVASCCWDVSRTRQKASFTTSYVYGKHHPPSRHIWTLWLVSPKQNWALARSYKVWKFVHSCRLLSLYTRWRHRQAPTWSDSWIDGLAGWLGEFYVATKFCCHWFSWCFQQDVVRVTVVGSEFVLCRRWLVPQYCGSYGRRCTLPWTAVRWQCHFGRHIYLGLERSQTRRDYLYFWLRPFEDFFGGRFLETSSSWPLSISSWNTWMKSARSGHWATSCQTICIVAEQNQGFCQHLIVSSKRWCRELLFACMKYQGRQNGWWVDTQQPLWQQEFTEDLWRIECRKCQILLG